MPNNSQKLRSYFPVTERRVSGKKKPSRTPKVLFRKPRKLTLCRHTRAPYRMDYPTVTLAGKWLHEAGFRSGQKVEITVNERLLVMRVVEEPVPLRG